MESKIKNASVLITGANGGIGAEVVKQVLERGAARVVLATRTHEKGEQTKLALGGDERLEAWGGFDMQHKASIEAAVEALAGHAPFDIVFLQAGGMVLGADFQHVSLPSGQRIEKNIYQNVLGGFITLESLRKHDLLAAGARIVFAGGEGARGIPGMISKPEYQSVEELVSAIHDGRGSYSEIDALGNSKFISALLVKELAEKFPEHEYVWFSPGLTAGTKGLRGVAPVKRFMMERIGFPMMQLFGLAQGPVQAAHKFTDSLDGKHGRSGDLIGAPEGKTIGALVDQTPMNTGFTNHAFRKAVYDIAITTL